MRDMRQRDLLEQQAALSQGGVDGLQELLLQTLLLEQMAELER